MPADRATRNALQIGRAQAQEVLKFRARALRRRAAALKAKPKRLLPQRTRKIDEALLRAVGAAQTAGVLIAEGDSWFDYPLNDMLRMEKITTPMKLSRLPTKAIEWRRWRTAWVNWKNSPGPSKSCYVRALFQKQYFCPAVVTTWPVMSLVCSWTTRCHRFRVLTMRSSLESSISA
jgi:hypothetical protein